MTLCEQRFTRTILRIMNQNNTIEEESAIVILKLFI